LAVLVEDGGAGKKAEERLKWLGKGISIGVASALLAGCKRKPEPEPKLVVVVYSSGLKPDHRAMVRSGVELLRKELQRLSQEYPEYPYRCRVEGPVPYLYSSEDSLRCGLSSFGEGSITDLFIFGHGFSVRRITIRAVAPGAASPRRKKPRKEKPPPKFTVSVGGILAPDVATTCRPFMKPPARVRIEACKQRSEVWESLSTENIKFSSPLHFEARKIAIWEAINDMSNMYYFIDEKKDERVQPMAFFVEFPPE
jgi:hypothetical protein